MTNPFGEIKDARCILAIGTNTTEAHPIIGWEVRRAARKGSRLIVANPREIALVREAALWLQYRPSTDVALIMGICRIILDEGLADNAFIEQRCENFGAFKDSLQDFGIDFVEKTTGVPRDTIIRAARMLATERPMSIIYAMGITQHTHGTDNVMALANLSMLTGNVGKPSSGVNPLRGQNNVQGACDMGALPNVFTGYQSVSDPKAKQKFEAAWGVSLPAQPGLPLTEILEAVHRGDIKALYLVGENPVLSDADANHVLEGLKRLDFLVVQDIFMTETAQLADVVLPGVTFAEKEGTFTNTERRIQRVRKAIEPVGNAKPDWWITCGIASRMGGKGFDYADPSQIMREIAQLTPSYGGISYEKLENVCPQWSPPMRGGSALGSKPSEPIAWAEELIELARAVDHPRLAFLYVNASQCFTTGRIEAAVGYSDAGQIVLGRSREALPYGIEAVLGLVYLAIGQPERLAEWVPRPARTPPRHPRLHPGMAGCSPLQWPVPGGRDGFRGWPDRGCGGNRQPLIRALVRARCLRFGFP